MMYWDWTNVSWHTQLQALESSFCGDTLTFTVLLLCTLVLSVFIQNLSCVPRKISVQRSLFLDLRQRWAAVDLAELHLQSTSKFEHIWLMFSIRKRGSFVSDFVNFVHVVNFGEQYLICNGIYVPCFGSCMVGGVIEIWSGKLWHPP